MKKVTRLIITILICSLGLQLNPIQVKAMGGLKAASGLTDLGLCSAYSKEAVSRLYVNGIIVGDGKRSINPKGEITRAQAVALIARMLDLPLENPDKPTFSDLSKTHWAYAYVEAAYRRGITEGTSLTTFSPDSYCTREELVSMVVNALNSNSEDQDQIDETGILSQLKDAERLSSWAKKPAAFAYKRNIISGYRGIFDPKSFATREQAAVILNNYQNYLTSLQISSVDNTFSPNLIAQLKKSVVTILTYDASGQRLAQGSGFSVGNGLFLTNYHVLEFASSFKITMDGGSSMDIAGIAKYDKQKDLAIIRTKEAIDLGGLTLGNITGLSPGNPVLAIGSPYGLQNTVSDGIVSAIRNDGQNAKIQITAPITHGSSGGPLFDKNGSVIGITSSGYDTGSLNFAIPIDYALDWVESLKSTPLSDIPVMEAADIFKADYDSAVTGINNTIRDMFEALENENLEVYRSALSSDNPVRSTANTLISPIFSYYDLDYTIDQITLTQLVSGYARVKVSYRIHKVAGLDYKDREMVGNYVLEDHDGWKITSLDNTVVKYLESAATPPSDRFLMNLDVTDAVMDPNRSIVYITEKWNNTLYAVNYETHEIKKLQFPERPERMVFANGKLYVILLKSDHGFWTDGKTNTIGIIDPDSFQVTKRLDIAMDLFDLAVDSKGHIYVSSGAGGQKTVRSYSEETGQEISSASFPYYQCGLEFNPAMDTLYLVRENPYPLTMYYLKVAPDGNFLDWKEETGFGSPWRANVDIAPDGNYVMNGSGAVFDKSLGYVTKMIRPFNDLAFNVEKNLVYAAVDMNLIYVYDGTTLKSVNSYSVGGKPLKVYYKPGKLIAITYSGGRYSMESLDIGP